MSNEERELKALLEKCKNDGGLNVADRQRYMDLSGKLGVTIDRATRIYEDLALCNLHVAQSEQRMKVAAQNRREGDPDGIKAAVELFNASRSVGSPTGHEESKNRGPASSGRMA